MQLSTSLAIDSSRAGFADAKSFGFEMNAMAFHAVIDGIYSNKIESPLREYCTNAFDAHLMVGKGDIPFEIQAPSQLNPQFRVRDFGPGMSHDNVMQRATTMFASDKRDTNNQVGMLGLGMKSAFAYTNIYTITAYDGRTKRVYNCFLDEGSMPTVASLPVEICTEPAGIEISFPVKSQDVYQFQRSLTKVVIGFHPQPKIVNEIWQPTPARTMLSGDNWRLVKHDQITQPFVKQGCVLYPLDLERIHQDDDFWSAYSLSDMPIIIDMPIGTCSVSTSREALGYDADTIENVRGVFCEILETARDEMAQSFLTYPTYFGACQALAETDDELLKLTGRAFEWKDGTRLRTQFELNGRMNASDRACLIDNKWDPRFRSVKEEKLEPRIFDGAVVLYEDDDNMRALARVRTYLSEMTDNRQVIWLKGYLPSFTEKVGKLEVVNLSTIELMKTERSAHTRYKTTRSDVRHLCEDRWLEKDFDLDEGGIFLFTDGHDYQWNGLSGQSYGNIDRKFLKPARDLGLLRGRAYALVSTQRTVPEKHQGWVNLYDHLMSKLQFDQKKFSLQLGLDQLRANRVFQMLEENVDRLPKRLQNFVRKVQQLDYRTTSADDHTTHLLWQNLTGKTPVQADMTLVEAFKKLAELYPLFDEITSISWHLERQASLLTHYLKLITKG